jgi:hypothetical protein
MPEPVVITWRPGVPCSTFTVTLSSWLEARPAQTDSIDGSPSPKPRERQCFPWDARTLRGAGIGSGASNWVPYAPLASPRAECLSTAPVGDLLLLLLLLLLAACCLLFAAAAAAAAACCCCCCLLLLLLLAAAACCCCCC